MCPYWFIYWSDICKLFSLTLRWLKSLLHGDDTHLGKDQRIGEKMIHQLLPFPRNFKIFLLSELMKKIIHGKRNFKYVDLSPDSLFTYQGNDTLSKKKKYIYIYIYIYIISLPLSKKFSILFSLIFFSLVRSFNFCHTSFSISFTLTEKHHAENRIFAP